MINLHIDELEKRWGKFKQLDNAKGNCPQHNYKAKTSKVLYPNLFFNPIPLEVYEDLIKENDFCEIPSFLKEIYTICNGLLLFYGSINIFGDTFSDYYKEGNNNPDDYTKSSYFFFDSLKIEYKKHQRKDYNIQYYKDFEYRFFGAIGSNYLAFKPGDEKIYVFVDGTYGETIKIYNNFQECYDHYFYGLMEEYDDEGKKKHPNEMFKKFPWFYNKTFKDF